MLGIDIGKVRNIRFFSRRACFQRFCRFSFFFRAHPLDGQHLVLRPSIAFFFDFELLPPQVAENRVFLRDAVVFEALGKIHLGAIGILLQQALDAPFRVPRGPFRSAAKIHVVLDLESTYVLLENVQFFIDGQVRLLDKLTREKLEYSIKKWHQPQPEPCL